MTPESQRIALAEWGGWKWRLPMQSKRSDRPNWLISPDGKGCAVWPNGDLGGLMPPDYLNDLNAVHELEERLDDRQREQYGDLLATRFCGFHYIDYEGWDGGEDPSGFFWMAHLTAAQRCEALLRTIGRWEEPK